MTDRCAIPRCLAEVEIVYLERGVCMNHWNRYTAEDAPPDALRMVLGIEADATTVTEERMATTKKNSTAKKTATAKTKSAPAAKAKKATRQPKPKAEKPGRVFAIRVTDDELAAIHKTAGPRNATRFVRAVAAAFAAEDEAAFRAVVREARESRA